MNTRYEPQNDNVSASIDVGGVLRGIWARKLFIFLMTLIAAAGSIAFVSTATPVYEATSRILVENQETDFSRTDPRGSIINRIDQQDVKSQVEVLYSRDLAKKVVKKLRLTERSEFDTLKHGVGPIGRFLISYGFKADPRKQTAQQRALGVYFKKMTAYQIPESKVIVVSMKSSDPKVATSVANTLGDVFISDTRTVQSKTTGQARDWLSNQIESLRKKVIESEVAAEKFRAKAGLLKGRDQNATLSSQELSELNSQIILAEAQRSEIQARAKAIRDLLAKTGSVASSSEVLNSQLIQRLRERQITLRGRLEELSTTYLPNHPRVAAVRREIRGLNRQVRSEALKIVSGLEQQAKVATAREASLRASLNGLKTKASDTNLDEVTLRALEREAKANRTLLETFLTKYSDASSREDAKAQPALARIISKADVPSEPSFPKPGPTVMLATIGGFVLSLGLAFMGSVMSAAAGVGPVVQRHNQQNFDPAFNEVPVERNQRQEAEQKVLAPGIEPAPVHHQPILQAQPDPAPVQQAASPAMQHDAAPSIAPVPVEDTPPAPDQVPGLVQDPSLSILPVSSSLDAAKANAIAAGQTGRSAFSTALAPISSWASSARQTLGVKRLAMLSMPGAEMDTAAACLGLARILAGQNMRVIIVDTAMQESQLSVLTQMSHLPGTAELLTGHASFADVIVKDPHSNVRLMSIGQSAKNALPLLAGDRMETVLAALENKNSHDIVIVHGGTVSADGQIENGAVAKCHSSLLFVPSSLAQIAGTAMQALAGLGMRSSQYIRIDGNLEASELADNVTQLKAGYA